MRFETPYIGPIEILNRYDPKREIGLLGQATTPAPASGQCPEHPWWWIALALVAGGVVGVAATKPNKRRRGRIE
jgi:ABC-type branched-subunit amino acid transport system permease subunit